MIGCGALLLPLAVYIIIRGANKRENKLAKLQLQKKAQSEEMERVQAEATLQVQILIEHIDPFFFPL